MARVIFTTKTVRSISCLFNNSVNFPVYSLQPSAIVGIQCVQQCSSSASDANWKDNDAFETSNPRKQQLSKPMLAYIERAKQHDEFIKEKKTEFEIGRRHLANMMGENPETFTQDDIDRSIAYLFPSGLFEPRARPQMKHPDEVFPRRKAAQFDNMGRPFHTLFYTGRPVYYQVLHDIAEKVHELDNNYEASAPNEELILGATEWVKKLKFEEFIFETITEDDYNFFIKSMERLTQHPQAYKVKNFIMQYRCSVSASVTSLIFPEIERNEEEQTFTQARGRYKEASAVVRVYDRGTGKISINGKDISYFPVIQYREQVIFPLQFTDLLRKVDIICTAEGGGPSGQAGAIRYGLSMALGSLVTSEMVEKMHIAGLLTVDHRKLERQKPGQKGARAKYTWKKR